jgi:hypothetical protein
MLESNLPVINTNCTTLREVKGHLQQGTIGSFPTTPGGAQAGQATSPTGTLN